MIQQHLEAESKDPRWSAPTESRILDLIAGSNSESGFGDIQVECRTTLCRVQLSYADIVQGEQFQDLSVMATMHGYNLRSAIEEHSKLSTVMFDSGIVYGTPMSLFYLRRSGSTDGD